MLQRQCFLCHPHTGSLNYCPLAHSLSALPESDGQKLYSKDVREGICHVHQCYEHHDKHRNPFRADGVVDVAEKHYRHDAEKVAQTVGKHGEESERREREDAYGEYLHHQREVPVVLLYGLIEVHKIKEQHDGEEMQRTEHVET